MKKILFIALIAVIVSVLTIFVIFFFSSEKLEPLPRDVVISKPSPDSQTIALILRSRANKSWDLLGSEQKFYLAFRRNNVTSIIDYDLSEGRGTYEGSIVDVKWLNKNEILIKRFVADQQADVIFNQSENQWKSVADTK